MEISKCVIFLLNILIYSGRIDYVFLDNLNEGSATGSETDGYAKNVDNLANDKRTMNTLKKINNGKPKTNTHNDLHEALTKGLEMKEMLSKYWLPAVHKIWRYWHKSGARQVMNTITSKLIRHASDKITKHVGNIIRSSVSSKRSISAQNAQLRSPIPLTSTTEVVLPALSITKLNEKGLDNDTLASKVKDLRLPEAAQNKTVAPATKNITLALGPTNITIPIISYHNVEEPSVQNQSTGNSISRNVSSPEKSNITQIRSTPANEPVGITKINDTAPAQNNASQISSPSIQPQISNLTSNASLPVNNNGTTNNHTLTIRYESDSGDITDVKHNATQVTDVPAVNIVNTTTNATVHNGTQRSEIFGHPSPVSSFVNAPPIGPMESINIDIKGSASTFKNFTKVIREHDIFRPSKTDILNFENNSVLSSDNIVKRERIFRPVSKTRKNVDARFLKGISQKDIVPNQAKSKLIDFPKIILYEGPISKELESMLMAKRSPSKAIRSSRPFQPISSPTLSKLPAVREAHPSRRSRVKPSGNKTIETHKFKTKDEGEDEQEDEPSGESGDDESEEIDAGEKKYKLKPDGRKRKGRQQKQRKHTVDSVKKVSPIKKVPILTIHTDENVRNIYQFNKFPAKSHKHKRRDYYKKALGDVDETAVMYPVHQKWKHHNGNSTAQLNRYKVYPGAQVSNTAVPETIKDFHRLPSDEVENEGSGLLSLDLTTLAKESKKVSLPQHVEIHSGTLAGDDNPLSHGSAGDGHSEEPPTFTLGHNHMEELPQNLPVKEQLHAGHNSAVYTENLPQDEPIAEHKQGSLLAENEQGPLPVGHEKGPLLPDQEHPGDFSHHENDINDPLTRIKLLAQCPCFDQHNIEQPINYNDGGLHGGHCEPCHGYGQGPGSNAHGLVLEHPQWNHHTQPSDPSNHAQEQLQALAVQASGPNYVEEPLQVPPVPAEMNPGIPSAVHNLVSGQQHVTFNLPSHHPILSLEGLVEPPLNNPPQLHEEDCTQHIPVLPQAIHEEGRVACPIHHEFPHHAAEDTHGDYVHGASHHEETHLSTLTPTLPFEIPSHHKFEKLGHNIDPELLSIIESNSQQVTSLSHEVKNIESRLGNVESIVEVLEKAVYRIEEKVDRLDRPSSIYQQQQQLLGSDFGDSHVTEEAMHNSHHSPLLKQYFVPMSQLNSLEGIKEIDHPPNGGGLPWPVNKVVSYLLQELQKNKNIQHGQLQPFLQLQTTPHVPLPQPDVTYPPKEHDIDRLEYEIGRVPKTKFGHKSYHYETLEQPCQCENGGECNGRSECDCPLRFTGPRCERPVPRSSLLDSIIDEIPADTQQQQQQYNTPKKTSLITLPLVISENNEEQEPVAQKTVGEINQSKLVNLLSQFFSPDYLQRFAKREKVSQRRYVKYPIEKEK